METNRPDENVAHPRSAAMLTPRQEGAKVPRMVSDHNISQVWLGLLDAERLSRYYQAMAARLQRWHMGLTAFVALGSTGAVRSARHDRTRR